MTIETLSPSMSREDRAFAEHASWVDLEIRQKILAQKDSGIKKDDPPPGESISWVRDRINADGTRGGWNIDWGRDFDGAWGSEVKKNQIRKKLEEKMGMSKKQAEYAVLFLALAGYDPTRNNIPILVEEKKDPRTGEIIVPAGVSKKSLEQVIDSFNPSDPRLLKDDKRSVQYAFFKENFGDMRDSEMRMLFPQDWLETDYERPAFTSIEEFAMRLAYGDVEGEDTATIGKGRIEDGVVRGLWMLEGDEGNGDNPYSVFQIRKGNRGKDGRYGGLYVQEDNLALCIKSFTYSKYNIDGPNRPVDFMHIAFKLPGGNEWKMSEWFNQVGGWKSEDGKTKYNELWMLMLLWTWAQNKTYNLGVERKIASTSLDKLKAFYEKLVEVSDATMLIFGVTLPEVIFGDALYLKQARTGGTLKSDNLLGQACITLYRVLHEGIADFDTLQKILGDDSDFFNLDTFIGNIRKGDTNDAFGAYIGRQAKRIGMGEGELSLADVRTYLSPETIVLIEKAFDQKTRGVKDRYAFTQLINIFGTPRVDQVWAWTMRAALQKSVKKQFDIQGKVEERGGDHDEVIERVMDMADANAWYFSMFMGGAARMDIGPDGLPARNDKEVEIISNRSMLKRFELEGDFFGNARFAYEHRALAESPLGALVVQVPGPDGKPVKKSFLKFFAEMQEMGFELAKKRREGRAGERDADRLDSLYRNHLGSGKTYGDAFREYVNKQWMPAYAEATAILKGEYDIPLDLVTSDVLGYVSYKRSDFAKGVGAIISRERSKWARLGGTPLTEGKRDFFLNPITGKVEWIDVPRIATMFSTDVFNDYPGVRKKGEKGKLARVTTHPYGKIRWIMVYPVDIEKLDDDRGLTARAVAAHKIAIMMNAALADKKGGVRVGKHHIDEMKQQLKSVGLGFFSDAEIAWIMKKAVNGDFWFFGMKNFGRFGHYLKWVLADIFSIDEKNGFLGLSKPLGDSFALVARAE